MAEFSYRNMFLYFKFYILEIQSQQKQHMSWYVLVILH